MDVAESLAHLSRLRSAVAQALEHLSADWQIIGLLSDPCRQDVKVSMGKILSSKLATVVLQRMCVSVCLSSY